MPRKLTNTFTLLLALLGCAITLYLTVVHYSKDRHPVGCSDSTTAGCVGVLKSNYAAVGPIPTALFGFGMYAVITVLCLKRRKALDTLREAEGAAVADYHANYQASETETSARAELDADSPSASPSEPGKSAPDPDLASVQRSRTTAQRLAVQQLDAMIWVLAALGFGISWYLQYISLFVLMSLCKYCFASATLVTLIFIFASRDFVKGRFEIGGEQKMLAGVMAFIGVLGFIMFFPAIHDAYIRALLREGTAVAVMDSNKEFVDALLPKDVHLKGDLKAPYTLVKFADFMCPLCSDSREVTDKLLTQYPDKLRFAYRHFPLRRKHRWSAMAAQAAEAAGKQGKFWEMHDLLFSHQKDMEDLDFNPDSFDQYAKELNLDVARFHKDRDSKEFADIVDRDESVGQRAGVTVTPTLFLISPSHRVMRITQLEDLNKAIETLAKQNWSDIQEPSPAP